MRKIVKCKNITDRGENQSMNNQHKYNKGGSHLTEGKTKEKSLGIPSASEPALYYTSP